MDIIDNINKNCCGCAACYNICPNDAIKMEENDEGFKYPIVNKNKCVNCGLCKRVCPVINNYLDKTNEIPTAYAVKNKNKNDVKKSSSGGVFVAIAKKILNNGGIVYGAAYDDNLGVNHIRIDTLNDLSTLQGSKYVQSNTLDIFKNIKEDLDNNKQVLFTGTPCQVMGLKNYLIKNYNNLFTCDLVCHGVPSQKLFKKYISYLEKKYNKKIIKYNFRDKCKKGWSLTTKVTFEDNTYKFINSDFDPYYSNFLNCTTYRQSCYTCKFTSIKRPSDITLADYWGVLSIHKNFYDENGVSLVLINSQKAKELFKSLSEKLDIIETDINYACTRNKNLIEPSKKPKIRDHIYEGIEDEDYIKKNLKVKFTLKKMLKLFVSNKMKKRMMKLKKVKK